MTANLPAERKPQLMAGAPVAALVPQSLEEAFRLAGALAASGMAPRGIDKPEQIMVAIMAGAELGLAPFQSLQSFAVVNGRPTLWGDGLIAVVRARGVKVKEWLEGEGDAMVAHCAATRPDTGEEIARTFTVADAKKAGLWGKAGPWQQYPKRMLQMRARALSLRDGCADMLRGIQVREEVEDYQHVREVPQSTGMRARLEARAAVGGFEAAQVSQEIDAALDGDRLPEAEVEDIAADMNVDPPTPDDLPVRDETPIDDDFPGDRQATAPADDRVDVVEWATALLRSLDSYDDVDELRTVWTSRKPELATRDPDLFRQVNRAVADRATAIGGAA